MQLRRAAGDVDRVRRGLVERAKAGVDRFAAHHRVAAVGPCVHVAVAAGHVAQLAEVDLEDFEGGGRERVPIRALRERLVEVARPIMLACERARSCSSRSSASGARRDERVGRRSHPRLSACSFICIPWTSDAPPRIAQAT